MTDDERMRATMEIMRAVGFERGTPASPEQIEKAKVLAKEKGLDPDLVAARFAMPGGRGKGGGGGKGGDRGGGGGGGGGGPSDRGFNNTIVTRTLYKLTDPAAAEKKIEPLSVKLGISDGFYTEVLDGLSEGDTVITGVMIPGAAAAAAQAGGMNNPFGGGSRGPSGMGGSSRGGR